MAQPYQPQGYAPPVQHIDPRYVQQYAPQYPMPPQGYPSPIPAQQQPTGPVGGQAMPTTAPALGQSARTGGDGPKAPAPRHLIGRTVIFEPIRIDEDRMVKDDKTGEMKKQPMATYHLTIVDGGPLQYADNKSNNPKEQHGYTMETQVPARFTNVQSDRFGIVNEVRDAMARGDMASVGVIQQGTRGNYPFLVTKTGRDLDGNDRPDGAERFERATLVWNDIFAKRFQSPEPRSLVAAPAQQPPQVQYQPQPAAPVQQPTYAQEYAAQTAPGFQTPYAAANPGTGPYGDGQPGMAPWGQTYQPPAQQPPVNPAFEAYIASLPPEQQVAARAQFAPQLQAQPTGPGF